METLGPFKGIYWVVGVILGLYWENEKQHGNDYGIGILGII